jgi:hypothetical protein
MIDLREGHLAHHVTVRAGPTPEQGVKVPYQLPGRSLPVGLEDNIVNRFKVAWSTYPH